LLTHHSLHRFTVSLPKNYVLTVVQDLHSLLDGAFTGDVLVVSREGAKEPTVRVLDFIFEKITSRRGSTQARVTLSDYASALIDSKTAPIHVIIDVGMAVAPPVDDLRPKTAVILAPEDNATAVTVAVPKDEYVLAKLGQVIETALRAVAVMPSAQLREAHRREAAIRAAFEEPAVTDRSEGLSAEGFISRFERLARQEPFLTAVRTPDETLTYQQLSHEAASLATKLVDHGIGRKSRILILPRRGASLIRTMLAAFKIGSTISMIDPRHPHEYIAECINALEPDLIVDLSCDDPGAFGAPVLQEQDIRAAVRRYPPMQTTGEVFCPDDCAIVTFTSGTTRVPKAVAGRYSSLSYFYDWMNTRFGPLHHARFGMCSSIGHDPLQRDIMTPLYLGGSVVVPEECILDRLAELGRWLREQRIEVVCLNPVLISSLDAEDHGLPNLRLFLSVGAALTRDQALRARRLAPNARILNLYGSTETQRAVGYFEVSRLASEIASLPATMALGHGMKDTSLSVVSSHDDLPCVPFEIGEIVVCSTQIGLGYLNDPELTAKKFKDSLPGPRVNTPAYMTGDLGYRTPNLGVIFSGRADDQVKVNGYRVELGEVNAACCSHPQVSDAVTTVLDIDGLPTLVTFLVPSDEALQFSPQGFRAFLARTLPHYAVPQHIITRSAVPLTINRKVDFETLKQEASRQLEGDDTDLITSFIRRHSGINRAPHDAPLKSLGIDSLRFTSLISRLIPDVSTRSRLQLQNSMSIKEIRQVLSGQLTMETVPRLPTKARIGMAARYGPVTRISDTEITFGTCTLTHCCSNDYLGLGTRNGAPTVLTEFFASGMPLHSHGSPEVNSHTIWHQELVNTICELHGSESALLFSSAYAANISVIPGVARPGDHVLIDESSHTSIVDGCLLSGAQMHVFRHNDATYLASMLEDLGDSAGRKIVITEGVFSVEGDIADLPALSTVARRHDCLLIVDEACSLGQIGPHGRGVEEHFELHNVVHLCIGTLAKALGSSGGYATGSRELIDRLRFERAAVFSTGLPPIHAFLAHRSAQELLSNGAALVSRLRLNAETWRAGLTNAGLCTGNSRTAIIPIMCGSAAEVDRCHTAMLNAGVFAIPVSYPWSSTINAVRTSVTTSHDSDDLLRLAIRVADSIL
jgi:amino acid adenylation domain-containing protein